MLTATSGASSGTTSSWPFSHYQGNIGIVSRESYSLKWPRKGPHLRHLDATFICIIFSGSPISAAISAAQPGWPVCSTYCPLHNLVVSHSYTDRAQTSVTTVYRVVQCRVLHPLHPQSISKDQFLSLFLYFIFFVSSNNRLSLNLTMVCFNVSRKLKHAQLHALETTKLRL